MDKSLRPYLVELVGTFAVVLLAALAVCGDQAGSLGQPLPGQPGAVQPLPGLVGIALAFGFAYAVALAFTAPYDSGYCNPAVTLMLWVFKRLDGLKTVGFIAVQLLGAALAGAVIKVCFSEEILINAQGATPHINPRIFSAGGVDLRLILMGIGIELAASFVLTFAIFAFVIDPRGTKWFGPSGSKFRPFWVGLVTVALVFGAFNMTGAALNPARWFGTVFWEYTVPSLALMGPLRDHTVYWIGPILGALFAGALYTSAIMPADEEQTALTVQAKAQTGAAVLSQK